MKKPISLGAIPLLVLLLLVLVGFVWHKAAIRNAPVYVRTLTKAPPHLVSIVGTNINQLIPYAKAPDKMVTPEDLTGIRSCLPKLRTFIWLYRPDSICVESPIEARVEFWRRRMPLSVTVTKTNGSWRMEWVQKGATVCFSTPPDWLDELSDRLPY
jgi:hypothetical protein